MTEAGLEEHCVEEHQTFMTEEHPHCVEEHPTVWRTTDARLALAWCATDACTGEVSQAIVGPISDANVQPISVEKPIPDEPK